MRSVGGGEPGVAGRTGAWDHRVGRVRQTPWHTGPRTSCRRIAGSRPSRGSPRPLSATQRSDWPRCARRRAGRARHDPAGRFTRIPASSLTVASCRSPAVTVERRQPALGAHRRPTAEARAWRAARRSRQLDEVHEGSCSEVAAGQGAQACASGRQSHGRAASRSRTGERDQRRAGRRVGC